MASTLSLLPTGLFHTLDTDPCKYKKRKTDCTANVEHSVLPTLCNSGYYTDPPIDEIAAREAADAGYCTRVPNFVVGRAGYGRVRFLGTTDVTSLELDRIVNFDRNCVSVYGDETESPPAGEGLNKAAEVTLFLRPGTDENALRKIADRQGAEFISFDARSGEWKFLVRHFSKFGFADEEEEDDVVMEDGAVRETAVEVEDPMVNSPEPMLSHSYPAFLRLDPARMQEMRMLMFPAEEDEESEGLRYLPDKNYRGKEQMKTDSPRSSVHRHLQGSPQKVISKTTPPSIRKTPQALIEYNVNSSDLALSRNVLMTGQNKGLIPRPKKVGGFKFDPKYETPVTGEYSKNIVDAALFMGRSFRVGWGPNGVLVHTGSSVSSPGSGLSSVITMEKVAVDNATRDEKNNVKEDLVDMCFSSPLDQHKELDRETVEVDVSGFKLELHKVIVSRLKLSQICQAYIGILHKQLDVVGFSPSSHVLLIHQITIWDLIKVLFSERKESRHFKPSIDDDSDVDAEEVMMLDKDDSSDTDLEAGPFIRRAEFSHWLQQSVCHRVQEEVSCLTDSSDLEQILLLLTGRQLDAAVELAASRGDVRLAILLSQAGGSMVNRSDMARQIDLWRINGLDFKYIEDDRLKLYELLAGNIHGALKDSSVDWKRFLGMVMWYQLSPDTSLSALFNRYQQLLDEGRAPHPVPVYIDEGTLEDAVDWSVGNRYDVAYYLMLLHANEGKPFSLIKTLFSAFSSTHDPLDYHMIWHQRSILEAIGAFSSDDLHVLDMSFITQLLCLGQCHWAIYVALHMMYRDGVPHIQVNLIREILFQYCETWSTHEAQRRFIEDLGIPSAWIHEALAIYSQYYGDLPEALEHFLECSNWHKAHSIFVTSVAHSLFLSCKHSEIWRIASSMEKHKSEIADWDLGAGIYIDFYTIKDSLHEDNLMCETDPLEKKTEDCKRFFSRLNESVIVWGSRLPVDARATYSKMAEEISSLLAMTPGETSTPSAQLSCFEAILSAPIPEDLRSGHMQDALSVFTYLLSGTA